MLELMVNTRRDISHHFLVGKNSPKRTVKQQERFRAIFPFKWSCTGFAIFGRIRVEGFTVMLKVHRYNGCCGRVSCAVDYNCSPDKLEDVL
jgi:hypothetical protein